MKKIVSAIAASLSLLLAATPSRAVELYNGATNQTLAQQGWRYLNTQYPLAPTVAAIGGGTTLNSGSTYNYAGFARLSPIALNRNIGYAVTFKVKVNSETHTNSNRAGFNILVLSDRLPGETQPFGIELGFWQNRIAAQNVNFTFNATESANFNTTALQEYTLVVRGNKYQLFIANSKTPIISGTLRQYTQLTDTLQLVTQMGYPNPYTIPNGLFIGDNTTGATANVTIVKVDAVSTRSN